jgi:hypothetical protein
MVGAEYRAQLLQQFFNPFDPNAHINAHITFHSVNIGRCGALCNSSFVPLNITAGLVCIAPGFVCEMLLYQRHQGAF